MSSAFCVGRTFPARIFSFLTTAFASLHRLPPSASPAATQRTGLLLSDRRMKYVNQSALQHFSHACRETRLHARRDPILRRYRTAFSLGISTCDPLRAPTPNQLPHHSFNLRLTNTNDALLPLWSRHSPFLFLLFASISITELFISCSRNLNRNRKKHTQNTKSYNNDNNNYIHLFYSCSSSISAGVPAGPR